MASVVLANCADTLRMDDEGRWIESKRMLRELQAPHTSRAQLRQWCRRFVKEKAWWQSKQCGLAPSSIHGLAAIVLRGQRRVDGVGCLNFALLLFEVSAVPRRESIERVQAKGLDQATRHLCAVNMSRGCVCACFFARGLRSALAL